MESHAALKSTFAPLSSIKLQGTPPHSRSWHLNRKNEGLCGTTGAQMIISQLNTQCSPITKLTLNRNPLGDDGISLLFNYLCSALGSRHRVALSEISLDSTKLGCKGLQAISDYLRGNDALRALWLANNDLLPDPVVFSSLASAVNDSRLRFLLLAGNNRLGDPFVELFLRHLHSPHLRELHINAIGLTAQSAPVIGAWISGSTQEGSTGACYLQTFESRGNRLGVNGVSEITQAIERGNWSITGADFYGNQLIPSPGLPSTETVNAMWGTMRALQILLFRNRHLKQQTEKEALVLLRYSRPLLMRSKVSSATASSSRPTSPPLRTATSFFPFYALPNELKQYILGLFAPSLSPAQCTRVYNYASDPSTLPRLLPPLRRNVECLTDPSNPLGSYFMLHSMGGGRGNKKCTCAGNSVHCRREEERNRFLEAVGCCAYEPGGESQGLVDMHQWDI